MEDRLIFDIKADENGFVALPFCLSGQKEAVLAVNWNDEGCKEERLDEGNAVGGNGCVHRYSDSGGWHRVEVSSPDWSKVYLCGVNAITNAALAELPMMSFAAIALRCHWRLKTPLPALAGTAVMNLDTDNVKPFEWKPELLDGRMDYAFTLMPAISELPDMLFRSRKWLSFKGTFFRCRFLEDVPEDLFREQNKAESFEGCFESAVFKDDRFPARIFADCTGASMMARLFYASNLAEISDGMLDGLESASCYSYAFSKTCIEEIPEGTLFAQSEKAEDFSGCFYGCEHLRKARTAMFASSMAKTFRWCFAECSSLDTLGSVFSGCENAEDFEGCFYGCRKLTSVPSDIFANCRMGRYFNSCFENCTGIIYLNAGAVSNLRNAESMAFMFRSCRSIKKIPERMFSGCTSVKTFAGVFEDCISIERIEEDVFRECENVDSFHSAFANCSMLKHVPVNLFAWSPKVKDFIQCFDGCISFKEGCLRIESEQVAEAYSFLPRNPAAGIESLSRSIFISVPAETKTYDAFSRIAVGADWYVMTYAID